MATLVPQIISRTGIIETLSAVGAGGDAAPCGINNCLKFNNGSGSTMTVTLAVPAGASGLAGITYPNTALSIPNGAARWIGPLPASLYADPTTGMCTITYSATSGVTVGLFTLPEP